MFCVKLLEKYLDLFKQCVIFAFGKQNESRSINGTQKVLP